MGTIGSCRFKSCCLFALAFFAAKSPVTGRDTTLLAVEPDFTAQQPVRQQCAELSAESLANLARLAGQPTRFDMTPNVLPGGGEFTLLIPHVAPEESVYCAKFRDAPVNVPVRSVVVGTGDETGTTTITLDIPEVGFWELRARRNLILVSFPIGDDNQLRLDSPGVAVDQTVMVSSQGLSVTFALSTVILIYAFSVVTRGKVKDKYRLSPVTITAGKFGRASLSRLQIYGFTILVAGLLVYMRLRTGILSDISNDVLLLLGISAGGTAGSQLAAAAKKRLTAENWAWLRNHGWLKAYEDGTGQDDKRPVAKWADLLKTNDEFDVYSLQLVAFSLVVAGTLLTSGESLATFAIPHNLLSLLALSNVVYLGGKAVGPGVAELNTKMNTVREAGRTWLAKVTPNTTAAGTPSAKQTAAIAAAPVEYQAYLTAAREAARMLKAIYGSDGTKFTKEPIDDDELMPPFP